MSVRLESLNLIVPITTIERVLPGGFAECMAERDHVLPQNAARVWHDEHLFRDGTTAPADMRWLVSEWEKKGFQPTEFRDGRKVWKDLCVIDVASGQPTLPCDWILIDRAARIAHYKGTEPGIIVGRAA